MFTNNTFSKHIDNNNMIITMIIVIMIKIYTMTIKIKSLKTLICFGHLFASAENEIWLEGGSYAFFNSPNYPSFYGPEDNREWVFCVSFHPANPSCYYFYFFVFAVYIYIHLLVCLAIHIYLSLYLTVYPSVFICLPAYLSNIHPVC